jgi:hypothetical protein
LANWTDPELGTFDFDTYCWTRTVVLPAFKVFQYGLPAGSPGASRISLCFEAEDESDVPTEAAVTIAKRLIHNQEALVPKLLKALFDDLHGEGPDSGMWWHGDIESIYESLAEESGDLRNLRIDKPDSLRELLVCSSIMIRRFGHGYETPLATICFGAPFEEEHGIGILTNGTEILGTGYEMDASPFE